MGMTECPAYMEARRQENTNDPNVEHTYECIPFHSQDSFDPEHSGPPEHSDVLDSVDPDPPGHIDHPNHSDSAKPSDPSDHSDDSPDSDSYDVAIDTYTS